jgi:ketosteroid isomerase-like protein
MKTLITLIAATCFVGAALGQQPSQPPKPGPEHQKLGIWVGDWQYQGEAKDSPMGPGGKFSGKSTARWVLNGFFVEFRGEDTGPAGTSQFVETDGYDPVNKRYTWNGFGSDGSTSVVTYTIDGTTVSYSGTAGAGAKQCQFRGTSVFAADFMSAVDKRECSADGKTWTPLAECKATKVASASAQVEQELTNLENEWGDAVVKVDLPFLDRILAEEITGTDSEGTVWTKAQDLATLKSGDWKCTSAANDDIKVRLYGDTAVVTGRNTNKSQYKGADKSGQYRWTDTFIRRDGRWQCVATHGSKIVEK